MTYNPLPLVVWADDVLGSQDYTEDSLDLKDHKTLIPDYVAQVAELDTKKRRWRRITTP